MEHPVKHGLDLLAALGTAFAAYNAFVAAVMPTLAFISVLLTIAWYCVRFHDRRKQGPHGR